MISNSKTTEKMSIDEAIQTLLPFAESVNYDFKMTQACQIAISALRILDPKNSISRNNSK